MADDLSLLLKIKGDAAGAQKAAADARTAIASLRAQSAPHFQAIQNDGNKAFGGITDTLNVFAGRLPVVGSALSSVASSAETAGSSVGAIAPQIGIAVAAFAALTSGVITLAKGFIDLTISTAEWEGKLFDLAQQTGVSVETLSTLSALAEDTGGSIESVAQSLVIFQGNIEEAQDSASKMGQKFADLEISTDNTEQSLRDAIKALAAMDEGLKQTNAAADLFGKRGGKQFLAILKESHGDIDTAQEKLRSLNSLVTGPVAKGADQLLDQLNATQRQFKGLQAQIVNESMPLIVKALQDLSRILRENRETFILLGQAIGLFLQGNLRLIAPAVEIATLAFRGHYRALLPLIEGYQQLAAVMQLVTNSVPNIDPNAIPAVKTPSVFNRGATASAVSQILGAGSRSGTRTGSGGGRAAAKDTALQDAIREADLVERELRQKLDADVAENKRAYEEQARDIEEYTRRAIELADERGRVAIDRINAEWIALQQALAKKTISEKEYSQKKRELDIQTNDAIKRNNDEIWELEQKRDRDKAAAEFAAHQRSAQLAEEASGRLIKIIQDRVEREILSEAEGERQIAALIAQGYVRRKELLEDELTRITTSLERKREINDELILLEGERAFAVEQAAQRITDAIERERKAFEERNLEGFGKERPRRVGDATRKRRVEEDEDASAIDQLFGAINENLSGTEQTAALAGLEALTTAFSGLGQAVGQVVEAWVLYGKAGQSIRQVTAQILAQVAAQAAVKAVFELAEGFAALALSFFGVPNAGPSAAAHFQAAAIYGSIAAVAAVAGRAIAGDSFKKSTDSGGGSSGGSRSASGERPGAAGPTDVNRRALAESTLTINLGLKEGIIAEGFKKDYQLNGVTRLVIKTDGQG